MKIKRAAIVFLAYSPIVLLCLQVLADFWYLIDFEGYVNAYFYLGWGLGSSFLFSIILVTLTEVLRYCEVSRWAARAQLAFSLVYLFIREDNIYNICIQIVIGLVALLLTFRYYKHKFPLCRLSLLLNFLKNVLKERSCEKGIEAHDRQVKNLILRKRYENENSISH